MIDYPTFCRLRQLHDEQGLKASQKALGDPSTRKAAHRLLVSVCQRLDLTNEAVRLTAVLARLPNDARLADPLFDDLERLEVGEHGAIDRADEWIKAGRPTEAAQLLEGTLRTCPDTDRALFFPARACLRLGECPLECPLSRRRGSAPRGIDTTQPSP